MNPFRFEEMKEMWNGVLDTFSSVVYFFVWNYMPFHNPCSLSIKKKEKKFNWFSSLQQVTDTNDNPPIFNEPAYSFDIPENAERGYQVGIISAMDSDLGSNSMISYTVISDWANDVFSLNPQTGVFTLTARLDYEEVS